MEGYYEQLKNKIDELKAESQDPLFTEYLQKLNNRLIQEKYQLDLIRAELDRSYQMYLKRMHPEEERAESHEEQAELQEEKVADSVDEVQEMEQMIQSAPQAQTVYFTETPYESRAVQQSTPISRKKKDKEFVIGIGVFSVIGVFFVLAAFVMLGMYFMNGFVKGMLLYAMAVAVWLVSELVVRKMSHGLSVTLSSIGIAGLYIATLVNYLNLGNFNELVAGIVLVVVTLVVFLVNRKKTLGIIQMASVAISTWVLMLNDTLPEGTGMGGREIYLVIYFVLSMLFIEAILYRLSQVQGTNKLLYTVYGLSMGTCVIGCKSVIVRGDNMMLLRICVLVAVVAMGALFGWLLRKNKAKWTQLFFVYATVLFFEVYRPACLESAIVLIVLLLFAKLLPANIPVKICNAGITAIAAIYAIGQSGSLEGYLILGAMVLSVLLIRYWQIYYEAIVTLTAIIVIIVEVESVLVLPLVLAVLWLSVVLFNQVERYRGSTILAYNIMALVCTAICYLCVQVKDYSELRIMYVILTVLGLGIIAFIFQERNRMAGARGIVIVSFLTYMILVGEFTYDITSSILMMLVGLGSIGAGFVLSDKKLRIYGLVLSMLICFKITLFDFRGEDILQKMLLFLAAGVVSLIISGIYVLLDKKYNK